MELEWLYGNKAIDIGDWSICEGGRLERFYYIHRIYEFGFSIASPFYFGITFITSWNKKNPSSYIAYGFWYGQDSPCTSFGSSMGI